MPEPLALMLLTAFAGGSGAVLRLVVDGVVTQCVVRRERRAKGAWLPYGILVVNVSGSLLIGLVAGVQYPLGSWAPMLMVGALGGYTTFSTAAVDTVRLLQRGRPFAALANGLGQLAVAVVAAAAGLALAHWFARGF